DRNVTGVQTCALPILLRWWWLYSSVVHVNLWHIDKTFQLAPSRQTYTTDDLSLAVHDLGWLYAQAVAKFLERYELLDLISPDKRSEERRVGKEWRYEW